MSTNSRTQLDALVAQIQEMWGHLDTLFEELSDTDGWDQKHGPHWTLADVPYHLTYFNCDLVARGLELGLDLAAEEQELLATPEDIDAWNARKFADRPVYQTPEQSISRWQASCEAIYRLTARMNDADLEERPFWMPFLHGWVTARRGLEFCRDHDWSVFTQLRIHMRHTKPVPSPAVTRGYLGTWMDSLSTYLNQAAANGREFTAVMTFTDPGVGAWTIRVADMAVTASEGEPVSADLVITQSAEIFEKSIRFMNDPAGAILSGKIQVSNFESLATFEQLFPQFIHYLP
jgi:hypothetical protein